MKHKQNQTAVQAVMRLVAQELVDGLPDTTAKRKIAREVYALFQGVKGGYANERALYDAVWRLRPREVSFDTTLTRNNQTRAQYAMLEAAKCLLKHSTPRLSKWAAAQSVFHLFRKVPGGYINAETFFQTIARSTRKTVNT